MVLGALLLLLFGTRIEPLRPDTFDFNLVGPSWLNVVSFTVLALFPGLLLPSFVSALSEIT